MSTAAQRDRLIRDAIHLLGNVTTIATGTTAGLLTHHALRRHSAELRVTTAVAVGLAVGGLTDTYTLALFAPLQRWATAPERGGVDLPGLLNRAVIADAARQAAAQATHLDQSHTLLHREERWTGRPDGSAVYPMGPGQYLTYRRAAKDTTGWGTPRYTLTTTHGTQAVTNMRQIRDLVLGAIPEIHDLTGAVATDEPSV